MVDGAGEGQFPPSPAEADPLNPAPSARRLTRCATFCAGNDCPYFRYIQFGNTVISQQAVDFLLDIGQLRVAEPLHMRRGVYWAEYSLERFRE